MGLFFLFEVYERIARVTTMLQKEIYTFGRSFFL